ncbi:hypothetical protein N7530_004608 [Penicillium desertorum]|uniref:Uncharacterized protein n=1 Tax=Penicillium desertorum TaxID=1303715 RepID=A0A9W9WYL3_9EURO|nr:hypothetical protein N7530_004608 [Penicillium desertorum]
MRGGPARTAAQGRALVGHGRSVILEHLLVLVVAIREGFPDGGGPAVAGAGDPDSSGSSFVIFSFIFAISRSLRLTAPFLQGPVTGIVWADFPRSQWGEIPPPAPAA